MSISFERAMEAKKMCTQCQGTGLVKSLLEKVIVMTNCLACHGVGRNCA